MLPDPRPRVFLVQWKRVEAPERIASIEAAGYTASGGEVGTAELRALRADPPDVVLVDLSRLPSHGRNVALALGTSPKARHVPIAFVEGTPNRGSNACATICPTRCSAPGVRLSAR